MELRELRAFVVAARELHFARAADRIYISASTMSELIRRLELELGTPLFTRTTRQVALTPAGTELLERAETILDLTAQATAAVQAVAKGHGETVRLGITPPAAPVIAPYLARRFTAAAPEFSLDVQRMWLPALGTALQQGTIDLALTCGPLGVDSAELVTAEIGSEPLLVGLRTGDRLAGEQRVELTLLAGRTLGMHPKHLFPAWHAAEQAILRAASVRPPTAELRDTDLSARAWARQPEIDWIMLIGSLLADQDDTVILPVAAHAVPFTLSWSVDGWRRGAVRRFVECSQQAGLPDGWLAPAPHSQISSAQARYNRGHGRQDQSR